MARLRSVVLFAAEVLKISLLLFMVCLCFAFRKPTLVSADSICLRFALDLDEITNETHIYTSLFVNKRNMFVRYKSKTLLCLLILMCGDIESCPGPTYNMPQLESLVKNRGMNLFHLNVQGLLSSHIHISRILQNFPKINLLTLSETHLKSNDTNGILEIWGFNFVSRHRENGPGGGVAAYISENIAWERKENLEHNEIECLWLEIIVEKSKNFLVCIFYRPPDGSRYRSKNFDDHFTEMLSFATSTDKEIILLGDANVDYLKRNVNCSFKDSLTVHGFTQTIKNATRITQSTSSLIDIIATNMTSVIKETTVIPITFSDHDMVGCVRKLNHVKFKPKQVNCRDYRKYNKDALCQDLESQDWASVFSTNDTLSAWEGLKSILTSTFDHHAPIIEKHIRGKPSPWLTSELKSFMNDRDNLLKIARKSNKVDDFEKYKHKRNKVNLLIKKAKSTYHQNLLNENASDPDNFWKSIKSIYKVKSDEKQQHQFFQFDGRKTNNSNDIANGFCKFFSTIVSRMKHKSIPLMNFIWRKQKKLVSRTNKRFQFKFVSPSEIEKLLKSLKRKKSTGIDNIPANLLKDTASVISASLAHVINLSLRSGVIPRDWKIARTLPLYKSGTKSSFDNYRPIAILPVLSKIAERVVHTQFMNFLETNNLLSDRQFGFRKKRSTETASTIFVDDIRGKVDKGEMVGAVFVDLSKAFDTLSHAKLLTKLESYGVKGVELEWFTDYLFDRHICVSYHTSTSLLQPVTTGVPQGSILGPLLFVVFFNDVTDVVKKAKLIKYADDTVLYFGSKDVIVINNTLTDELKCLAEWLDENELLINLKKGKTECLLFGTAQKLKNQKDSFKVFYKEVEVVETNFYQYLGVELTSSLSLASYFQQCYKKAAGRLRLLHRVRPLLTPLAARSVYVSMVIPTLTYCSILNLNLTKTQSDNLKSLERRADNIVNRANEIKLPIPSIINFTNKRACTLVQSCLENKLSVDMNTKFKLISHIIQTRNNNHMLKLPSMRTEYGKRSFCFMAAKIFNTLPLELRKAEGKSFLDALGTYFGHNDSG